MRKVMVVDDEMFVRKGLHELIPWNEYGFDIVAEAEDGEEAIPMIGRYRPDVVVTDIRMPVMDGLTMIEKVKGGCGPSPEFIILSGYNEFSYAQRAMRFGVQDFILKPIDENELIETLRRVDERLSRGGAAAAMAGISVDDALNELLFEETPRTALPELAAALGLLAGEELVYCIVERNVGCDAEGETEGSLLKWKSAVGDALVRLGGAAPLMHDLGPYTFGVLLTSDHFAAMPGEVEIVAARLLSAAGRQSAPNIRIYAGSRVSELKDLKLSYRQARQAMLLKYALSGESVITAARAEEVSLSFRDLDAAIYSELQELLEANDVPGLSALTDRIGDAFRRHAFAPDAVMASLSNIVSHVLAVLRRKDGDNAPAIASLQGMMQWNQAPKTLDSLMKGLQEFLVESAACIDGLRKTNAGCSVHKIRQYIEAHFREEISLKSMAKRFYINPVYLGQLFKNTYGVYFNDFLLELRIQEAKRLLRQTDLKIYEIAGQVGFSSSEYFIKQFEKVERRSPTEFKHAALGRKP